MTCVRKKRLLLMYLVSCMRQVSMRLLEERGVAFLGVSWTSSFSQPARSTKFWSGESTRTLSETIWMSSVLASDLILTRKMVCERELWWLSCVFA